MTRQEQDFSYSWLEAVYRLSLERGYRPVLFGEEERETASYIL